MLPPQVRNVITTSYNISDISMNVNRDAIWAGVANVGN